MSVATGLSAAWCVCNLPVMRDYLRDRLGFKLQGEFTPRGQSTPSWASLLFDKAEIMLLAGDYPEPAQDWAAYIWANDVDALFSTFSDAGADIKSPPVNKAYGNRELEVRLPDGRILVFASSPP